MNFEVLLRQGYKGSQKDVVALYLRENVRYLARITFLKFWMS